jgi:hypothetical protein
MAHSLVCKRPRGTALVRFVRAKSLTRGMASKRGVGLEGYRFVPLVEGKAVNSLGRLFADG